jgi:hypothetical protein
MSASRTKRLHAVTIDYSSRRYEKAPVVEYRAESIIKPGEPA